ncbi:hypothetical protein QZH41_004979 [Actinostola sp. cb2023]|nr:hypothetical protein QZH41_004979 [Actinostola sp. cb2023]
MVARSVVKTAPFEGQKPGTSGLRKPVAVFQQNNYTENFVQATLDAIPVDERKGCALVVGGDGGIILTASHNPGGIKGDFGIKYNISNGGPAPEAVTNKIFDLTKTLSEYKICYDITVDLSTIGSQSWDVEGHKFTVIIKDSVDDYVKLMKEIFDFPLLKSFLSGSGEEAGIKLLVNAMNGVIAENLQCIPYFLKTGTRGFARSMPTSAALDRVAKEKGIECFETPTAWLSILATRKMSIADVLQDFWTKYGRNFFTRYDYENVDAPPASQMMDDLRKQAIEGTLVGKSFTEGQGDHQKTYTVKAMDDFSYTDPIDGSISTKQGVCIIFSDGSRIIYRLSGTGSVGATVRVYIESYESDPVKYPMDAQV